LKHLHPLPVISGIDKKNFDNNIRRMYQNQDNPMKLVVITNPYDIKFEIDRINRMFDEGLDELHIRKPECDMSTIKKIISQINKQYHDRIVLHSHYSLVNTFDIHKIHLGHDWIFNFATEFYLNKIILRGKKVSKSMTIGGCSSLYKPIKGINELVLGPVFSRASYTMNNQQIPTDEIEKGLRHSKLPVIALGGVTSQTLEFFKNIGFNGIAIQSGVWKSPDPVEAFLEMRDHYMATQHKLRIAV
jgi:thiamine monophosphate synthase